MAKRNRSRNRGAAQRQSTGSPHIVQSVSPLPNAAERALFDIGRLLEGQQFESSEDANPALQQVINASLPRLERDIPPLQGAG